MCDVEPFGWGGLVADQARHEVWLQTKLDGKEVWLRTKLDMRAPVADQDRQKKTWFDRSSIADQV